MSRPNAAQLAYGSATVVFSTLALLLLSRTTSPPAIFMISAAGLVLGLLVTVTMPAPRREPRPAAPLPRNEEIRVPAVHAGAGADTRIRS
ncbi:hypothetical protein ACWDX6_25355 [Streptomyces sp. NPDC003027]